jgi:hypothetical protein
MQVMIDSWNIARRRKGIRYMDGVVRAKDDKKYN